MIVCSIRNFSSKSRCDPGDITVAPAQTLSDKEYRRMRRDASLQILRKIGVETGS